jgi:hypothetical protein
MKRNGGSDAGEQELRRQVGAEAMPIFQAEAEGPREASAAVEQIPRDQDLEDPAGRHVVPVERARRDLVDRRPRDAVAQTDRFRSLLLEVVPGLQDRVDSGQRCARVAFRVDLLDLGADADRISVRPRQAATPAGVWARAGTARTTSIAATRNQSEACRTMSRPRAIAWNIGSRSV